MPRACLVLVGCGALILVGLGLTERRAVGDEPEWADLLRQPQLAPETARLQVQDYCERRVPQMPEVARAGEWDTLAADLRDRTLREVVLRGEAAGWAEEETRIEWLDEIDVDAAIGSPAGTAGYRIRKLRYEAVPGMWVPALLYEPTELSGPMPVVMNVNGHDASGKSAKYKQMRCINQAKRGMLALNVEWLGMGQLRDNDFYHYRMNQLDLCGTSGLAPFYLSMKRGLDVLLQHDHADPERVAVAGLSGGGWQTIFISGLDERVTLSNPVAGYSSFRTRARVLSDLGDSEQTPSDLATVVDYTHLTAMRAPRPTLLTNNDRDGCCFAAGHALPPLLEAARPIYSLYEEAGNLWVHINHVPGSHNFLQDNREALYRMFAAHFFPEGECPTEEIDCSSEVLSAEQLGVALPEPNAGFNTLAQRLAKECQKPTELHSEVDREALRKRLQDVLRCRGLQVQGVSRQPLGEVDVATVNGLTLRISDEWTVPGIELVPESPQRTVIVVCDGGRVGAARQIRALLEDGVQVWAVDPFYFGESRIPQRDFLYALLVAAVGERPLGIQVDQIRAIARLASSVNGGKPVELFAVGRRLGLAATAAAALEPETIGKLTVEGGMMSLREVIEGNVAVNQEPELFCFGLLATCDIPSMEALIAPREVVRIELASEPQRR